MMATFNLFYLVERLINGKYFSCKFYDLESILNLFIKYGKFKSLYFTHDSIMSLIYKWNVSGYFEEGIT